MSGDISSMLNLGARSAGAAHWSRQQYERLFAVGEGHAQSERSAWVVVDDAGECIDAAAGEESGVVAFLAAHKIDREWELENIVVAKAFRRRGLARLLLGSLIAQAREERGASIFLEVRESNQSARALYRQAGFEETGLRKRYYTDPAEDAVLCTLRL
jgi:ribosomal-protein-alanine N-acetyltransferase